MAVKWHSTPFKGVRYYEHETRRNGVKKDQYFAIRYQKDGRRVEEGLGWASEKWTAEEAAITLAGLKKAAKIGEGHTRLAKKREAQRAKEARETAEGLTFGDVFESRYLPHIEANRRNERSVKGEASLFKVWLEPVLAKKALKDIAPLDLERIKRNMTAGGRAERTIRLALAVVRQVLNYAANNGLFFGTNPAGPAGKVKRPRADNRRTRYLTEVEAEALLAALKEKSQDVHDQALLSLHTGVRAGEIFSLTWGDVNLDAGTILIKDTKSGHNRHAFITDRVRAMLKSRPAGKPNDLVFPARNGKKTPQISNTFERVVADLKLNQGITDRRQRVTFHTCRHTFASRLVERGVDIYHVKELLGHQTIELTARYSHLSDGSLRAAVARLEQAEPGAVVELGAAGQGG